MTTNLSTEIATAPPAVHHFFEQNSSKYDAVVKNLKIGIWLYFFLLIFEGALRKWFLPSLATPLLVVRDPIVIWVLIKALNNNLIKASGYVVGLVSVAFVGFFTAITLGHGNIIVATYGMRAFALHFPFMFVMAKILKKEDVIQFGKALLLISIGMAVLIAIQFNSPQSAWVNVGVGGDEGGAGFSGALGFFRPPGTFSFTNGNTTFFSFAGAFVVYFWLRPSEINRWLHIVATAALLAAIPLSISRSLFFSVLLSLFFAIISTTRDIRIFKRIVTAILVALIGLALLSQTEFFQTATLAFTTRLEGATESEGGVQGLFLDRYLGGLASAILNSYKYPFFGYGIGIGTNVGSMLLRGKTGRIVAEGDWGRTVGELGLLFGLIAILIRVIFSLQMMIESYNTIKRGNVLPWMLISFGLTIIPQGEWAQPTALGFSTIIGGLILAAFNE